MKRKLHYVSPKGSAEMIAAKIGEKTETIKEALMPAYLPVGISLMFLGCEGTKMDKLTNEFINTLDASRVNTAALFCCNPKKNDNAIQQMKAALNARGVKVMDSTYVCSGKGGLFGGKHPTEEELEGAAKWAVACMEKYGE